ncbi:hypothetical protein ACFW05_23825, partial [Streptomyces albogriseolus]
MANTETSLKECLSSIDGATAAALVDYTSGMALGTLGGGQDPHPEVAPPRPPHEGRAHKPPQA